MNTSTKNESNLSDFYHVLISNLIELNKEFRLARPNIKNDLSVQQYALSFCTVTVDIGRQTGKSEYLVNATTENDITICSNPRAKEYLKGRIKGTVISECEILHEKFESRENQGTNIYFDDASYINPKAIDKAYFFLSNENIDQTFVKLG